MSGRAKAKMQYCQHWEQPLDSNLFVTLPSLNAPRVLRGTCPTRLKGVVPPLIGITVLVRVDEVRAVGQGGVVRETVPSPRHDHPRTFIRDGSITSQHIVGA